MIAHDSDGPERRVQRRGADLPVFPHPATPAPAWFRQAACRGMGPSLFFPELGGDTYAPKRVCWGCPVRTECAEHGANERFGIFGGKSERQRRVDRKRRAA